MPKNVFSHKTKVLSIVCYLVYIQFKDQCELKYTTTSNYL